MLNVADVSSIWQDKVTQQNSDDAGNAKITADFVGDHIDNVNIEDDDVEEVAHDDVDEDNSDEDVDEDEVDGALMSPQGASSCYPGSGTLGANYPSAQLRTFASTWTSSSKLLFALFSLNFKPKMDILIEMPAVFFYNTHLVSFYGSVMRTRDPWIVMNESSHRKYFWKVCPFLTNMREWKNAYYTHKINRVLQIIWIKFAMNVWDNW